MSSTTTLSYSNATSTNRAAAPSVVAMTHHAVTKRWSVSESAASRATSVVSPSVRALTTGTGNPLALCCSSLASFK